LLLDELIANNAGDYYTFKAGDYIIREGEKVQFVYWLLRGKCARKIFTYKGHEFLLGIKASKAQIDSVIGINVIYNGFDGVSNSNIVAETDCFCYRISKQAFMQVVDNRPDILIELLHSMSRERKRVQDMLLSRQEGSSAQALCKILLEQSRQSDDYLRLTNVTLAYLLGVHRVTVGRILKRLQEKKIIHKKGQQVKVLDYDQLQDYATGKKTLEY